MVIQILINKFISLSGTCSAGTETDCLTCDSTKHRTFDDTTKKCLCDGGFYDDGENEECKACDHSW